MIMNTRFDGYFPVVIDLETSGTQANTDALLELSAILLEFDQDLQLQLGETYSCHIEPFPGARLDPKALEICKIDPFHPFRFAITEDKALLELFAFVKRALKKHRCRRAVLVGHNAHFDLNFIQAAIKRCELQKESPFHSFTCFDTATLAGIIYGKTTLAKAVDRAGMLFDAQEAHSAIYDAECTAKLFCKIVNAISRL